MINDVKYRRGNQYFLPNSYTGNQNPIIQHDVDIMISIIVKKYYQTNYIDVSTLLFNNQGQNGQSEQIKANYPICSSSPSLLNSAAISRFSVASAGGKQDTYVCASITAFFILISPRRDVVGEVWVSLQHLSIKQYTILSHHRTYKPIICSYAISII